jgi:heptaprenylglyceryl phosphate synthase
MSNKSATKAPSPMTVKALSRIQSHTAKANGGGVPSGSFAARAARAVAGQQKVTGGTKK